MRQSFVIAMVLLVAGGTIASAAEGRIPLLSLPGRPYSITQAGHYILTRNVASLTNSAVVVQVDDVTLDLGGFTIAGSPTFPAIRVSPPPGVRGITIKNGRIVGGLQGVEASAARFRIRLERLEIVGSQTMAIWLKADIAEIIDCHVHDLAAPAGPAAVAVFADAYGGRVLDNLIEHVSGDGLWLGGFRAGEIRRNIVRAYGDSYGGAAGISIGESADLYNTGGAVIADNTVSAFPDGIDDFGIVIRTRMNFVTGNVAFRNGLDGILVDGDYNRLERNVTNFNQGDGIRIADGRWGNYLGANQSQSNNGCGLNLGSGGSRRSCATTS